MTDSRKTIFWVFFDFSFFPFRLFFFVVFVLVFSWGFKSKVRWPKGPPHLALNPPHLFFFVSFAFLVERFKAQVRWPKGPPHLALNPPYFFAMFFFFWGGGCFRTQKNCFPPPPQKKGHLCLVFSISLCFSLAFCFPAPFHSLFLCLSLVSFFILRLFCLFFLASLFLSLYFSPCFFAFVSWKEQHQNITFGKKIFNSFFVRFLSCFVLQIPFSNLLFFFPDFKFCFCSTSMFVRF